MGGSKDLRKLDAKEIYKITKEKCPYCGKTFLSNYSLKKHLEKGCGKEKKGKDRIITSRKERKKVIWKEVKETFTCLLNDKEVIIRFLDDSSLKGRVLRFSKYDLLIDSNGKKLIALKHAIKSIELIGGIEDE